MDATRLLVITFTVKFLARNQLFVYIYTFFSLFFFRFFFDSSQSKKSKKILENVIITNSGVALSGVALVK